MRWHIKPNRNSGATSVTYVQRDRKSPFKILASPHRVQKVIYNLATVLPRIRRKKGLRMLVESKYRDSEGSIVLDVGRPHVEIVLGFVAPSGSASGRRTFLLLSPIPCRTPSTPPIPPAIPVPFPSLGIALVTERAHRGDMLHSVGRRIWGPGIGQSFGISTVSALGQSAAPNALFAIVPN